jgi:hypothetical protein
MSAQPPPSPQSDYQRHAQEALAQVRAASQNALKTFMTLIYNPVGALPGAYNALPGGAALGVGIVFMVVWLICTLIGAMFGASVPIPISGVPFSYKVRGLLILMCIPVGLALGMFAARKAFKGAGSLAFDVFVSGASLLMIGFAALVGGLLGGTVFGVLMLVGGVIAVLVVFTGLTRVAAINEGVAAYLVAGVFVVAGLLVNLMTRILF